MQGVGGAQAALDQDDGDQPSLGGGPLVQVRGGLDLRHDVLGQASADPGGTGWQVPGEEHRGGRQAGVPVVLADGLEERADTGDGVFLGAVTEPGGGQPRQVAFQHRPVQPGEGVHLGDRLGQEDAEAGQRRDVVDHGADRQPAGEP